MLRTLILKEFLDNLLNLRFLAGLAIAALLTVLCLMLQSHSYSRQIQDHRIDVQAQNEFIEQYGPTSPFFTEYPRNPPEALSPVVLGLFTDTTLGFDANFVPELFHPLDLVFIVSIIMSLLGILFSYDSICGERESGTLKLVCSNSFPRATILFGKWIGGTASLLVPFLVSILLGAVYITSHPGVSWHATDWLAFTALAAASTLYISMFYLLGLAASAFSRSSSVAILKSLLLWMLIVLVLPNLGPYVSTRLCPIPSLIRLKKENNELNEALGKAGSVQKQLDEKRAELDRRFEKQYGDLFRQYKAIPDDQLLQRTGMEAPESDLKEMGLTYRWEWRQIQDKIYQPIIDGYKKIQEKLELESKRQTEIAKNIAAVSPYADYLYLASDLAATGFGNAEYVRRHTEEYMQTTQEYSQKKSEEKDRKRISDWRNMKNSPFDLSDRPHYVYQSQPLAERVKSSLPWATVLALFNILFFTVAFAGFLRYDVR